MKKALLTLVMAASLVVFSQSAFSQADTTKAKKPHPKAMKAKKPAADSTKTKKG